MNAVDQAARGDYSEAIKNVAPISVQNALKGAKMAVNGYYQDTKGRKVVDTDGWDALMKGFGFQPSKVANVQGKKGDVLRMKEVAQIKESDIVNKWASGIVEGNSDKKDEARRDLAEWNEKNPDSRIKIDLRQVSNKAKQIRMTAGERLMKSTPKELRGTAKEMMD